MLQITTYIKRRGTSVLLHGFSGTGVKSLCTDLHLRCFYGTLPHSHFGEIAYWLSVMKRFPGPGRRTG